MARFYFDAERILFAVEIRSAPLFTEKGLNKLPIARRDTAISRGVLNGLRLASLFRGRGVAGHYLGFTSNDFGFTKNRGHEYECETFVPLAGRSL